MKTDRSRLQRHPFLAALVPATLCALPSYAGDLGEELPILFMVDPGTDQVYRLIDADDSGSLNDPGEVHVFYDSTVGGIQLIDPVSIVASANDFLYVADRGAHAVFAMEDLDDDGDCHDVASNPQGSEHFVYLDASNGSGVPIGNVDGVTTKFLGLVWVATSHDGSQGIDAILRCQDLNADLDANDAGEIEIHFQPTTGDPRPVAVETGPDDNVYYVENGIGIARGLYRIHDDDRNDVFEAAPYFLPPGAVDLSSTEFNEHLGIWHLVDAGAGTVYQLADSDRNEQIDGGEWTVFFQGSPYEVRDVATTDDAEVYWPRDAEPEGIEFDKVNLWLDLDQDGAIELGEQGTKFDETEPGTIALGRPVSIDRDFHGHEEVGEHFCDASAGCPCANDTPENPEAGCRNSTTFGAMLEGEGTVSASLDDLAFHATFLPPNQTALLFVGLSPINSGAGASFGDGLRCVGGGVIRLGIETIDAGGEAEWGPGLLASTPGGAGWSSGDARYFQVWYRDPSGGPAPNGCGTGFNLSVAIEIVFER